jgi:hypothetical protein
VEGTPHPRDDGLGGLVRIGQDASGGHPQNPEPVFLYEPDASLIEFCTIKSVVRRAVHFDNKPFCQTAKISDVGADWMLTTEFEARRSET